MEYCDFYISQRRATDHSLQTIVGTNAWVLHRNKQVYGDDAEAFRPERWIEEKGQGGDLRKKTHPQSKPCRTKADGIIQKDISSHLVEDPARASAGVSFLMTSKD